MPWYTRTEWPKILALSRDLKAIGESFDDWLQRAEKAAKIAEVYGHTVEKVRVDAEPLAAFMKANGVDLADDKVRWDYASLHWFGKV